MLEKDITNLDHDVDSIRRTFLAIKGNLPLNLAKVLTPLFNIEDQAPRVKRDQRNLTDQALLANKRPKS